MKIDQNEFHNLRKNFFLSLKYHKRIYLSTMLNRRPSLTGFFLYFVKMPRSKLLWQCVGGIFLFKIFVPFLECFSTKHIMEYVQSTSKGNLWRKHIYWMKNHSNETSFHSFMSFAWERPFENRTSINIQKWNSF